jgi:DNA-binding NtrC family response regulator
VGREIESQFARHDGGTVFFDEIGELPQRAQSIQLEFLQAREGSS